MNDQKDYLLESLFIFSMGLAIVAATLNLFYNRSLWHDEALLALNIMNRSFDTLHQPLDLDQVAPIGFLYVEKVFASIFGNNDWSMRIFPFLSYLASIPLFFLLSLRLFNDRKFAFMSYVMFSSTYTLIHYSSEVKQYATDVLAAVAITLSTLIFLNSQKNAKSFLFAIVGVISIWFSNVAIIILFSSGLYCLFNALFQQQNKFFLTSIIIFTWIISFCIYYVLFIHNHPTREFMIEYWGKMHAFAPSIFSADIFKFLVGKIRLIYGTMLSFGPTFWVFPLLISLLGLGFLKKHKKLVLLSLLPFAVHVILSSFQLYPVDLRLILYLTPFFILLYINGIKTVFNFVNIKILKLSPFLLLIPVLFNFYTLIKHLPVEKEEIKKSINYVYNNMNDHDKICVVNGAKHAFRFYLNNYPKLSQASTVSYLEPRLTSENYLNQIASLDGNVWMIFTHIRYSEERGIVDELKKRGLTMSDYQEFEGSSLYKFVF